MQARLVWSQSGDEIKLQVCWPDLFEYYVEQLADRNQFVVQDNTQPQDSLIKLQRCIDAIRQADKRLPLQITAWDQNLLDQQVLNQLHREWVQTGQQYPNLPVLLRHLKLDQQWRGINEYLHDFEGSFDFECKNYTSDQWQVANPFGRDVLDFNTANVELGFDNLGRSSWDKFMSWDDNTNQDDTNDFRMLSGRLLISLNRPMSHAMPVEYQQWCQTRGIETAGRTIRLGNFVDLQSNLTKYRSIFLTNINEPGNQLILTL